MVQDSSNKRISTGGITVVEVIIGVTLLSVIVVMVLFTMTLFLQTRSELVKKTKALFLAEEGIELLRYLRDEDWTTVAALSKNTPYSFTISGSTVAVTSASEVIDSTYTRQFVLKTVYRNSTEDLALSGGGGTHDDDESVWVEMNVGYGAGTTTLETVLTNIFDL